MTPIISITQSFAGLVPYDDALLKLCRPVVIDRADGVDLSICEDVTSVRSNFLRKSSILTTNHCSINRLTRSFLHQQMILDKM